VKKRRRKYFTVDEIIRRWWDGWLRAWRRPIRELPKFPKPEEKEEKRSS